MYRECMALRQEDISVVKAPATKSNNPSSILETQVVEGKKIYAQHSPHTHTNK